MLYIWSLCKIYVTQLPHLSTCRCSVPYDGPGQLRAGGISQNSQQQTASCPALQVEIQTYAGDVKLKILISTFYVVDFNVPYVIVLNLLNRKVLPMFVYFEVIISILKTFKVTRIESVQWHFYNGSNQVSMSRAQIRVLCSNCIQCSLWQHILFCH